MLAGLTYYQILWYFLSYALLGWVVEVAYHAVTLGKVVNRGFLNGPLCPIYGIGMVGVLMLSNLAAEAAGVEALGKGMVFLLGMCFSTLAELAAGWAMDRLFHTRWWDYSDMPLNFHGYICAAFSILWGIAVVMAVEIVHPFVANYTAAALPEKYGWPILAACYAGMIVDLCVTVATILGMNRRLRELDELNRQLRTLSDRMSRVIAENTIKATVKVEEGRVQAALGRAELKESLSEGRRAWKESVSESRRELETAIAERTRELEERRAEFSAYARGGVRRLMLAYPKMDSRSYREAFQEWRKRLSEGEQAPGEAQSGGTEDPGA